MNYRFAAPDLLRLGQPPRLAARSHEDLRVSALEDLIARFNVAGISYDTGAVAAEPAYWYTLNAAERDMLRRKQIDDAVARTYLGFATGAHLDARAADYGVVRRHIAHTGQQAGTVEPLRPSTVPPLWQWDGADRLWREDDESLRMQTRLAWEALSVAGPAGAYLFHAGQAHPMVAAGKSAVYGPETGLVDAGEVLLVILAHGETGIPLNAVLDSVAARLDAYEIHYATGDPVVRTVRDRQSVRPLGAKVILRAAEPLAYDVNATLYVDPRGDRSEILQRALANLARYQESRRQIGARVPVSSLEAALALVEPNGIPVVEDVDVAGADIVPHHLQFPLPGEINVEVVVR